MVELSKEELSNLMTKALHSGTPSTPNQKAEAEAERCKERQEREAAASKRQEAIAKSKRIMFERKFTCVVCGKSDVGYRTAREFNHLNLYGVMYDIPFIKLDRWAQPIIEDGDVVVVGNPPFIVCREQCRKDWLRKYALSQSKYRNLMKLEQELPCRIAVVPSMESLKNDITDAAGVSNRPKIDSIIERLDGNRGFYLKGIAGSGKTTIAASLVFEYLAREQTVKWITYDELQSALGCRTVLADELMAKLVYGGVSAEEYSHRIDKGKPWGVVVIDDLSPDFQPQTQEHVRLKRLFSQWYERNCKLIVTSNIPIVEMGKAIAPMVSSRMQECLIEVTLPAYNYRQYRGDE